MLTKVKNIFARSSEHQKHAKYQIQTAMLYEIGKAMISSIKGLQDTLELITSSVTNILQVERSLLMLIDEENKSFTIRSGSGLVTNDFLKNFKINIGEGIIGKVAKEGIPKLVKDQSLKPENELGVSSFIAAPLKIEELVLGVITADSKTDRSDFTDDDLKLLNVLASLAAIDVQNAKIHEMMRKKNERLKALFEIGKAMTSTLELQKLLDLIIDKAIQLISATSGSLILIEEGTDVLIIKSARGLQPDAPEKIKLKFGEGITGLVAKTGKSIREGDVSKNPNYITALKEVKSELAVPMILEGKTIGVINVDSTRLNAFSSQDEELLSTLSSHATVAINNAKLFADLTDCRKKNS